MLVEKKKNRLFLASFALTFLVDAAISCVLAFFAEDAIVALWVYGAILAIRLIVWLRGLCCKYIVYRFLQKEAISHAMFTVLKAGSFPDPEFENESINDYLSQVLMDEELPVDTRIRAAAEAGSLNYLSQSGRVIDYLLTALALEEGLRQYQRLPKQAK